MDGSWSMSDSKRQAMACYNRKPSLPKKLNSDAYACSHGFVAVTPLHGMI